MTAAAVAKRVDIPSRGSFSKLACDGRARRRGANLTRPQARERAGTTRDLWIVVAYMCCRKVVLAAAFRGLHHGRERDRSAIHPQRATQQLRRRIWANEGTTVVPGGALTQHLPNLTSVTRSRTATVVAIAGADSCPPY